MGGQRDELRGVMIGAGYFAQFQAEAWNRIAGVRMVAVADAEPGKARAFADRWHIANAYEDAATMLQRERPDFVDIVTRPESHLPLTRLAAEHRVHVICQKPMAPDMAQCQAMVAACRAANVRLIIHENWRWQPWYREIRRLLDEGELGRLFHIGFHMRSGDGRGPEPYAHQPYFRQMPKLLIYETLIHFLDTVRYLVGEIESVACETARINPIITGEDYALVQMKLHDGVYGTIDANRITGPMPPPVAFGSALLEADNGVIRLSSDGSLSLAAHGQEPQPIHVANPGGYKGDSIFALQRHIMDCLRSGSACESEGCDYLKTMAAVFACYDAAEHRHVVRLSDEWQTI